MCKLFFWCGRPQVKGNQALAFELPERSGHEHQQSGNAASFLAENEKKTIILSSFLFGAVDGTCSATLRAQAVLRLFLRR